MLAALGYLLVFHILINKYQEDIFCHLSNNWSETEHLTVSLILLLAFFKGGHNISLFPVIWDLPSMSSFFTNDKHRPCNYMGETLQHPLMSHTQPLGYEYIQLHLVIPASLSSRLGLPHCWLFLSFSNSIGRCWCLGTKFAYEDWCRKDAAYLGAFCIISH